ncbi:MAG: acyl-CoA thioesterase/BAAT N-terminal domain-containing protein, partial [Candidatus Aminicenantes bacterium]|nr:acyl-CoA thioesterase/BAAT N-terminal domain-containing protein [Candidatus Aminicenantes bacterium]
MKTTICCIVFFSLLYASDSSGISNSAGFLGLAKGADIQLEIVRSSDLVDEDISLRLKGLSSGKKYLVRAETQDDMKRKWVSSAEFEADREGEIDCSSQSPVSGSYDKADPAGLFWSMGLEKPAKGYFGMFAKMSAQPQDVHISVTGDNGIAFTQEFPMKYVSDAVSRDDVKEGFVGKYFVDKSKSSLPAVIVTGGSGGGFLWSEQVAAVLASRGYAALAVAYFDYRGSYGLPNGLAEIPLEYFERSIQWLRARK